MTENPRRWRLNVVGELSITGEDGAASDLSGKSKRMALLLFLALPNPGRWIRRDIILATLWPEFDSASARNALRVSLHKLRRSLGESAIRKRGDDEISVDPSVIQIDLTDLDRDLESDALSWLTRPSLELAPGLHVPDAPPFGEWLDGERRGLTARLVAAAWAIVDQTQSAEEVPRALDAARAAVRLAPENETGRRRLIALLDRSGDRAGALHEYELFETWLRTEFGVAPAPETSALVARIRARTRTLAPDDPMPAGAPLTENIALAVDDEANRSVVGNQGAARISAGEAPASAHGRARFIRPLGWAFAAAAGALLLLRSTMSTRETDAPTGSAGTPAAGAPAGVRTTSSEARQLALDADFLLGRRTRDELLRSRDLWTRALEIDPQSPDLWIGLSRATGSLAYRHFIDYRSGYKASEHAADEALKRAPDDARALVERGMARFGLGDLAGAEADMRRAAGLDTADFRMQGLIGTWWMWRGGPLDSALHYAQRAATLAPWERQFRINVFLISECMSSAAGIAAGQRVLDLDPNEPFALEHLAWLLADAGQWEPATGYYLRRFGKFGSGSELSRLKTLRGRDRFYATVRTLRSAQLADQRRSPPASPPLLEARISLYEDLGMRDSSIAALRAVNDQEDAHHAYMMCAHNLRDFRRDPRVQAIVRERHWPLAEFEEQ